MITLHSNHSFVPIKRQLEKKIEKKYGAIQNTNLLKYYFHIKIYMSNKA